MTIPDNYVPLKQIGNGVTIQFSASWPMLSATYAQVFLQDSVTGVQTAVTQGVAANQYQIVLTSTGWTVTFGTAPTSTQYVIVGRSTQRNQLTPYTTSTGFQGANEEFSYDKLTAMLQETANTFSRAIVAPLADSATLVLPPSATRANQFLAFDASGNVVVIAGTSGGVSISTAMQPVVQAATIAVAQGLLGIAPNALTVPTHQTLTSGSGTYTTPANVKWLKIRMVGGGGGGAGSGTVAGNNAGVGGTGGSTTFGTTLIVANGGNGGSANGAAVSSPGGTASVGVGPIALLILTGSSGAGPSIFAATNAFVAGGVGGNSPFGGGGAPSANAVGGSGIPNTGSGGSGGSGFNTIDYAGGGGAAGGYAETIIPAPLSTYSYVVGAGGSAGSAGTSGLAGGVGGSGVIVIEEHYNY